MRRKREGRFISCYFAPIFFLLIFVFPDLHVSAQDQISDTLVKERIQYIQKMLDEGKPGASLWWNGWLYGYSAGTLGQGIIFFTSDKLETQQDMALGAATSLIAAVGQLVMPMIPASAPKKLSLMPGETPEQRILKLQQAEELFEASSKRESEGRSWKMHAISGGINLSSGLVTWLGFKRTVWAGLGNFALNSAISELQIFTQPTRAIKDYERYCDRYLAGLPQSAKKPEMRLLFSAYPGGITAKLIF